MEALEGESAAAAVKPLSVVGRDEREREREGKSGSRSRIERAEGRYQQDVRKILGIAVLHRPFAYMSNSRNYNAKFIEPPLLNHILGNSSPPFSVDVASVLP